MTISTLIILALGCSSSTKDTASEPQTEPATTPEPTDDPSLNVDDDGDGYTENEGDCDDSDPLLNPLDEDQDGASPCDGDCDDNNNTLNISDADGDGQSTCAGDCDDSNAVIYKGAAELCDGQVNDCADALWGSAEIPPAERDEDGDGYVSCESTQSEWVGAAPVGYGDCDDTDPSLNNADLDGDGYSNCTGDCDDADPFAYSGAASNESATECMRDEDGDGYGEIVDSGCCYSLILTDSYGDGWNGAGLDLIVEQSTVESFENTDLNLDGGCFSGCEESVEEEFCVADGANFALMFNSGSFDSEIQITLLDDNSTTLIDVSSPQGELYAGTCEATSTIQAGSDCDDTNPDAYPGATELWYNDVDEDCDQSSDFDQDGDGDDSEDYGGGDCDDLDPSISSTAIEDITDGIDNNCNNQVDERFVVESLVTSVNTTGPQPLSISHDSADNAYIVFEDNGGLSLLEMDSLAGWSNRSLLGITGSNTGHLKGAIDSQDRWQIVYTSQSGATDLVFRNRDINGTWSSEMLLASVSNGGVDAELRIGFDIDSNDNPSALFYDHQEQAPVLVDVDGFTNSQINNSTSQLVDLWVDLYNLGSTTGTYASLAIDSSDQHHMIFLNSLYTESFGLGLNRESQYNRVLNNDDSTECGNLLFPEQTEDPIEPDNEGIDNSVAIKSTGEVCVAYRDDNLETLKYSCNNSGACGGWPVSTVVDSNDSPAQSVLVFDSNDNPTIAYVRSATGDLMIAHHDGSGWSTEAIDELGTFGGSIDLSISPSDVLRLAFIDDQGTLRVARGQY